MTSVVLSTEVVISKFTSKNVASWLAGLIDVVVVNLYPFYITVTAPRGTSFEKGVAALGFRVLGLTECLPNVHWLIYKIL